jgi:hypothetical protein
MLQQIRRHFQARNACEINYLLGTQFMNDITI